MKTINLANCVKSNIKVLSGREFGKKVRVNLKLDQLDQNIDSIEINIPDYIFSVNSSFFLGVFGKSVRELGESGFRNKYRFNCDEVIRRNVEDGISRAVKDSNALERLC